MCGSAKIWYTTCMSTTYPSDLSDAEWEALQRYLPALSRHGRPRTHPLRSILDAIFYILRAGCPWRYLPCNFPPLADRVLPFSAVAPQRHLVSLAHCSARGRTPTGGEGCPAKCSYHGCPKCEDH